MPGAEVSWLLYIGRLVSKTGNVMHFTRLVKQARVDSVYDRFVFGAYIKEVPRFQGGLHQGKITSLG